MIIECPDLQFSSWYKWNNRQGYPLWKYPGVYCISITEEENLEGHKVNWNDVVYIGMTNAQKGLRGRWDQFQSAIHGKGTHSGGNTIYKDIGHYDTWMLHLYVAAMGIEVNVSNPSAEDYRKMGMIAYLEYEAFAQHFEAVGGHPKYNKR